uniref:Putative secreted protein n=1 Tax=Haematobia irritans TaxID=7368 RepID=A0A1L8E866_HAEIR
MLSTKFFIITVAILSLIVLSAPAAEGTFILACLLRSPLCPFFRPPARAPATTTTPAPTPAPNQPNQEGGNQNQEEYPEDDAGRQEPEGDGGM